MIHNQTVTPPLAAIDGTTFKLKTATTKSRIRSQRPRTRFKFVGLAEFSSPDICALQKTGGRGRPPHIETLSDLMRDYRCAAFLLCFREGRSYVRECCNVLVDVGFGVLDRDRPLLIPPVGLGHDATIHHRKPVMPPQVDVNGEPVAVVANFFWIKHQRSISPCADYITLQSRFGNDLAIAVG